MDHSKGDACGVDLTEAIRSMEVHWFLKDDKKVMVTDAMQSCLKHRSDDATKRST